MQDFLLGFQGLVSDPLNLIIFAGALLGGLLFGAIPGLNGVVLATILLPFTSFLPRVRGSKTASDLNAPRSHSQAK